MVFNKVDEAPRLQSNSATPAQKYLAPLDVAFQRWKTDLAFRQHLERMAKEKYHRHLKKKRKWKAKMRNIATRPKKLCDLEPKSLTKDSSVFRKVPATMRVETRMKTNETWVEADLKCYRKRWWLVADGIAEPLEHHQVRVNGQPMKIRRLEKLLAKLLKQAGKQKQELKSGA